MSAAESFAATGQEMFVDGSWGPSRSGETYEATSPATGEVIGTDAGRRPGGRARGDRGGAHGPRPAGPGSSAFERAALLHRVADVDRGAAGTQLARTLTLDQGKPLRAEAYDEVDELVTVLADGRRGRQAAGRAAADSSGAGKRALLVRAPARTWSG